MSDRNIARTLVRKYGIEVRQARYGEDGQWYHHLEHFPAAFIDKNGYIVFKTIEEYQNCPYLQLRKDVNVTHRGISSIPGYTLFNAPTDRVINESAEKYTVGDEKAAATASEPVEFTEGAIEEMVIELRERDPHLKLSAIKTYGTTCQICGFSFSQVYGSLGEGYIEIHHLRPLSEASEIQINTIADVALVCSNCHRMLHRKGKTALQIEELKKIIEKQRQG